MEPNAHKLAHRLQIIETKVNFGFVINGWMGMKFFMRSFFYGFDWAYLNIQKDIEQIEKKYNL